MNKKYELTNETIEIYGRTLHRIKAVRAFSNVKVGDLGGYIESESNLSHGGDCWVRGNAEVCGDAEVCGNAEVCGDAEVCGNADYACISGFGTAYRTTTFFRCKDSVVRVQCGCFYGNIDEFRQQVKNTRNGKIAREYLMIADLMELHFDKKGDNI